MQNPGIEFMDLLFLEGYYIEIGTMSIVEGRLLKWEGGMRKAEKKHSAWRRGHGEEGIGNWEVGSRNAEVGINRMRKSECGIGKVSIADYGLRIAELQSIEQGIDESGPAVVR
jgi:hypothetical protein